LKPSLYQTTQNPQDKLRSLKHDMCRKMTEANRAMLPSLIINNRDLKFNGYNGAVLHKTWKKIKRADEIDCKPLFGLTNRQKTSGRNILRDLTRDFQGSKGSISLMDEHDDNKQVLRMAKRQALLRMKN